MAISSVSLHKGAGKFLDAVAKNKFVARQLEQGLKHPVQYAAKMMVVSFVSKDLVNTCFYTYQSFNNEKIPKDQRSFVAFNDLVLGFFNFFGQIGSFYLFERLVTPKIAGRNYSGNMENFKTGAKTQAYSSAIFSSDNLKKYTAKIIKDKAAELKAAGLNPETALKNLDIISESAIKKFGHGSSKCQEVLAGLGIVIGALSTNALVKRSISTIFSTPIAGALSERANKKATEKEKKEHKLDIVESQVSYQNNKLNEKNKKTI